MISPEGVLFTESNDPDPCNVTREEAENMSLEDAFFIRMCLVETIKSRDGYKSAWYSDRELLDKTIKHYQEKLRIANYLGYEITKLDTQVDVLQEYRKNTQGSELE